MNTLYYNPETKVVFASEDQNPAGATVIAVDAVPDLIANGATVDASAIDMMGKPDTGATDSQSGAPAVPVPAASANGSATAGDAGNAGASAAAAGSASDTALSANAALPEAGTAEVSISEEASEPDHKSILQKLFDELEGIMHMGKSEIIAVVDGAKSMVKG